MSTHATQNCPQNSALHRAEADVVHAHAHACGGHLDLNADGRRHLAGLGLTRAAVDRAVNLLVDEGRAHLDPSPSGVRLVLAVDETRARRAAGLRWLRGTATAADLALVRGVAA